MAGKHDPVHLQSHTQRLGERRGDFELETRLRLVLAGERQRVRMGADVERAPLPDRGEGRTLGLGCQKDHAARQKGDDAAAGHGQSSLTSRREKI